MPEVTNEAVADATENPIPSAAIESESTPTDTSAEAPQPEAAAEAPDAHAEVKRGDTIGLLEKALADKTAVKGQVIGWNKGGYHVAIDRVAAFCPVSQLEIGSPRSPQHYLDKTFSFHVIEIQQGGRRVVVSRAAALQARHEAGTERVGIGGVHHILEQLRLARDAAHENYSDVTHRELAWQRFRELATGPLWTAVERLKDDPYRRQLADVLDAAVSKLEASQLNESHFSTIDSTLSRLAAETVTENDVDACQDEWQAAEVAVVPTLRDSFEEWLACSYVGIEDGD